MTPTLREILSEFGNMPGFSTCECAHCFGMRNVERRATPRQAFHTVMGADLFEAIAADMGVHWALVAAFTAPKCSTSSPAYKALCAISEADVDITYEPLPSSQGDGPKQACDAEGKG